MAVMLGVPGYFRLYMAARKLQNRLQILEPVGVVVFLGDLFLISFTTYAAHLLLGGEHMGHIMHQYHITEQQTRIVAIFSLISYPLAFVVMVFFIVHFKTQRSDLIWNDSFKQWSDA